MTLSYHWLYGNYKFNCEDLDYFMYRQQKYNKPFEEVEDSIKTIIKDAL